jgi:hypothetical protein
MLFPLHQYKHRSLYPATRWLIYILLIALRLIRAIYIQSHNEPCIGSFKHDSTIYHSKQKNSPRKQITSLIETAGSWDTGHIFVRVKFAVIYHFELTITKEKGGKIAVSPLHHEHPQILILRNACFILLTSFIGHNGCLPATRAWPEYTFTHIRTNTHTYINLLSLMCVCTR